MSVQRTAWDEFELLLFSADGKADFMLSLPELSVRY